MIYDSKAARAIRWRTRARRAMVGYYDYQVTLAEYNSVATVARHFSSE